MPSTSGTPYGSQQWRKLRPQIMERDGGVCQIQGPECTSVATDVDHIMPWRAGGSWYDPSNLRASCRPCNSGRVFRGQTATPSREWT